MKATAACGEVHASLEVERGPELEIPSDQYRPPFRIAVHARHPLSEAAYIQQVVPKEGEPPATGHDQTGMQVQGIQKPRRPHLMEPVHEGGEEPV